MSTGLFALTAVDVISKLTTKYTADIRDPNNSMSWRCLVCFAIITASGLVIESSVLLISFAMRAISQISFVESVVEDFRSLLLRTDDQTVLAPVVTRRAARVGSSFVANFKRLISARMYQRVSSPCVLLWRFKLCTALLSLQAR